MLVRVVYVLVTMGAAGCSLLIKERALAEVKWQKKKEINGTQFPPNCLLGYFWY